MGQHSVGFDMLCLMGILNLLYIQVYMLNMDLQNSQVYIDMQQLFLYFDKQHWIHKVRGYMDLFFLLQVQLKCKMHSRSIQYSRQF